MTTKIQTRMIDYDWDNVMDTTNIAAMFPVGHLLITTNVANPATYGYKGVWELLPDNANLRTAKTTSPTLGAPAGSDTVSVPLPAHTHGVTSREVSATGKSISPNLPSYGEDKTDNLGLIDPAVMMYPYGASNKTFYSYERRVDDPQSIRAFKLPYNSPINIKFTPQVTINNTGTPNASLNVAGRTIDVLVWQRIA